MATPGAVRLAGPPLGGAPPGLRGFEAVRARIAAAPAPQPSPQPLNVAEELRLERELLAERRRQAALCVGQEEAAEQRRRYEERRAQRVTGDCGPADNCLDSVSAAGLSHWLRTEVLSDLEQKDESPPYEFHLQTCPLGLEPSAVVPEGPQEAEYILESTELKAIAPGVAYRFSKQMEHKDEEGSLVPWGTVLMGIDEGDGWLRVGDRFLPMCIQEVPILSCTTLECEGKNGVKEPKESNDPVARVRAQWRAEEQAKLQDLTKAVDEAENEEERRGAREALDRKLTELAEARKKVEAELGERKKALQVLRNVGGETDKDHYCTLGVARTASSETIATAYRSLSRLCHPDKSVRLTGAARRVGEKKMSWLNAAYQVLSCPQQRWKYDRTLAPETGELLVAADSATAALAGPTRAGHPDANNVEDEDFDFSGDGKPYRFARGRAARVCASCGSLRKERVRLAMSQLRGVERMDFGLREDETYRYGFEVVRHVGPNSPFCGLGETGSSHRVAQPGLRENFRDFIVEGLREALRKNCDQGAWWGDAGLRYASLGSGELLFDVELIERLRHIGVRISQICLIDRLYREPSVDTRRALRVFADWQRCAAQLMRQPAAEVLVFGTLQDYYAAAAAGQRAAGCHLMVHCDAHWEGVVEDCERLAVRALVPRGLLARLANFGDGQEAPEITYGGELHRPFNGDPEAGAGDGNAKKKELRHPEDIMAELRAPFKAEAWTCEPWPHECCRPPALTPVEHARLSPLPREPKSRARRCAEEEGLAVWRVVHGPRVPVRAEPNPQARVVDVFHIGEEVVVADQEGPWLRLAASSWADPEDVVAEAWVLSDGSAVGLGPLLELVGEEDVVDSCV